ncbi:FeoC-like transcriptional regulator [Ignatzschineria sp. RMDPL8A]|uniref:FeoC-like transcriptional regulator n=1 Tax=Ignatzschineria sp. RMDPL8A TaxID=2999236 RepID=UPI0024467301|nr:FeoC-like transcriptional regulator [Ignatzschineria sp. RMDPL8A]MDG9729117.1 FeoC-like transcriptional regulator [Ignatzschineria sp. RMDPL8A]
MLLIQIRDYIRTEEIVSLQRLANHFNLPMDVAKEMVERWIGKGLVTRVSAGGCGSCTASGGCGGCSVSRGAVQDELYEWSQIF